MAFFRALDGQPQQQILSCTENRFYGPYILKQYLSNF